jgi:hypothetical protein
VVSGPNQALAAAVAAVLRARGFAISGSSEGAHIIVVYAEADISLRPSPFQGSSARTADYVSSLEVRVGNGPARRFQFDGHVMDFGANVVRAAAVRQLAERMATVIQRTGEQPWSAWSPCAAAPGGERLRG